MNRNILIACVLVVGVIAGAAGYKAYLDNHQPDGVRIDVGPNGLSVKGK